MININDILNICNGELVCGDKTLECKNFINDTRKINNGDVYIGIKGDVYNGNIFYKEAFDKGAIACILDRDTNIDKMFREEAIILVDNTIEAIQKLASYKRSLYNIPVIAVTGSVGKTSVKDMIYSVLSSKFNVLSTKGNLNNHIGVPLTILSLDNHDALIVEMGMNHFGELSVLSKIAKPTMAVITNIGTAHIGNLGSRENILKAKLEVLDGMDGGSLFINNDNDLLSTIKYDNLITIGIDNNSNYMAHDIIDNVFSSSFYINNINVKIPVGSKAFIYNALFAYAIGDKLGISSDLIIKALESFKLNPHRLELINHDKYTIIDDTYNASLDSVNNALAMLSKVNKRRVFIFADILELEQFGVEIHKEIGINIINSKIDMLITVGNLSKHTHDIVKDSGVLAYHFDNNNNLIDNINEIIRDGDMILVKGSHSMNLESIVDYLKHI